MAHSIYRTFIPAIMSVVLVAASTAHAQAYPEREITFIVPYGPGGGADPISRQFASQLAKVLKTEVNVENKPGGSSTVGIGQVVRSRPNGYMIGFANNTALTYQPLVNSGLAYKSTSDYQVLVKMSDQYNVLFVRADARWKGFKDFLAEVKNNPGKIRAGTAGIGTSPDHAIIQLNKESGSRLVSVPFSGGSGEATVALLGGRVESMVAGISSLGLVQAGKIRAIGVFKSGKYPAFPDTESIVDAGYNASLTNANFIIAPAGIPRPVLDKLAAAALEVVRSAEFAKFGNANGYVMDPKGMDAAKAELDASAKMFSELLKFSNANK